MKKITLIILLVQAILLLVLDVCLAGYDKKNDGFYLNHFAQIPEITNCNNFDGRLFRGGYPNLKNKKWIEILKKNGIQTVINLRSEDIGKNAEKELVESNRMKYIFIPISITHNSKKIKELFYKTVEEIRTSDERTFIHCQRGEDRTGVFIATLRDCPQWKTEFKDFGGTLYPALKRIMEN